MAKERNDQPSDRRDVEKEGSSLSGSRVRDNATIEKGVHPENQGQTGDVEKVDQDPGHRQKQNQNQSKDDPLAA